MHILSLHLQNIRSYTNQLIEFSQGSVLLSGDIGSGKSTILLAIEFVLFGIIRGTTDAASLLRNGEQKGFVTLICNINEKEVSITRTLIRTKNSITQSTCTLTVDGMYEQLTPTQLKSKVIDLLGYPQNHQAKSMLYRYTVYTSQEEMKHIIIEDPTLRLNTLRQLFGIDKYQAITSNTQLYIRELKRKESFVAGQIDNLSTLTNEFKKALHENLAVQHQIVIIEDELKELDNQKTTIESFLGTKKEKLTLMTKDNELLEQTKYQVIQVLKQMDAYDREITELKSHIAEMNNEIQNPPKEPNKDYIIQQKTKKETLTHNIKKEQENKTKTEEQLSSLKKQVEKLQDKIIAHKEEYYTNITLLLEKKQNEVLGYNACIKEKESLISFQSALKQSISALSEELDELDSANIGDMKTCTLCKQDITLDHKEHMQKEISQKQQQLNLKINSMKQSLTSKEETIVKVTEKIAQLDNTKKEIEQLNEEKIQLTEQINTQNKLKKEIKEISAEINNLQNIQKEFVNITALENEEKEIEKSIELLLNEENRYQLFIQKQKELEKFNELIKLKLQHKEELFSQIEKEKHTIAMLEKTTLHLQDIQMDVSLLEDGLEECLNNKQETKITYTKKTEQSAYYQRQLEEFKKEIEEKEKQQKELQQTSNLIEWLKNKFIPLMTNIEKQVFMSIYQEFNSYFVHWFSMLIEDETLLAKLGYDFSPIIEQNGYETNVTDLSGGEKTCVALAYRLALNKVINDLIEDIHTKGILILDEPTDGFSSEQLDRVRDVLQQLNLRQLMIVSHEQKLETFVEHVITIQKQHHISTITT